MTPNGDLLVWSLERFGPDDQLIEECAIPHGIAFELMVVLGVADQYDTPACYAITSCLFLSASAREDGE